MLGAKLGSSHDYHLLVLGDETARAMLRTLLDEAVPPEPLRRCDIVVFAGGVIERLLVVDSGPEVLEINRFMDVDHVPHSEHLFWNVRLGLQQVVDFIAKGVDLLKLRVHRLGAEILPD